jgi:hypothetical protein
VMNYLADCGLAIALQEAELNGLHEPKPDRADRRC